MATGIAPELVSQCQDIFRDLNTTAFPTLASPEGTPKRASVALILRFKPSNADWPSETTPQATDLASFFAQSWVQHGDPEVLFIKRAYRKGDRWTSHVALPGGKRDPEDADDQAAAIRETWEEVGLDLIKYGLPVGNLPQRLVTAHWGKKPLMVLCPYVFVLTTHYVPPLRLQPTEIAATHWVPLNSLKSPSQRTYTAEDVASRLANAETGVKNWMLSLILGKMIFAAIHLLPSESLHSVETPVPETLQLKGKGAGLRHWTTSILGLTARTHHTDPLGHIPSSANGGPLLLWGLTLGVVSDFLDLYPPHDALTMWTYPTFTPIDVQFCIWLFTYRFKQRKSIELQSGSTTLHKPIFGTAAESLASSAPPSDNRANETGMHGLGSGITLTTRLSRKAAVSTMLEGFVERLAVILLPNITDRARYYDIVRKSVKIALLARFGLTTVLAVVIWRKYGRT